jgi:hypothetical protein
MTAVGSFAIALPEAPYPGLRPFGPDEWPIFFGRESMADEVIGQLIDRRVIVIHGDSGCGKSSLIRAGVQPRLEQEHERGGIVWRTCRTQPREAPLRLLATSLATVDGSPDKSGERTTEIHRLLNLGVKSASRVAASLGLGGSNNLCVLIDQFEELFDFARTNGPEQARLLTQFVIGVLRDRPEGLHVILTMRSEFLGACAQYPGFAEAVNETQYLLPRMSHESLLRAIREPASLYRGHVALELAERLIGDAQGGQDQLPLIQHGLMMLYRKAMDESSSSRGAGTRTSGWRLDVSSYEAADGLRGMLSRHADVACSDVGGAGSPVVEYLFRALIDINAEGQAIRRPRTLAALRAVTGADQPSLVRVVDRFRAADVSFLQPYGSEPLGPDSRIDISHEALIRCWSRIADAKDGWLAREFQDGLIWRSLVVQADSFDRDPSNILSPATALERRSWMTQHNAAWARRYGADDDWQRVERMVEASLQAASDKERIDRRNRRNKALTRVAGVALISAVLLLSAYAVYLISGGSASEAKTLWSRLDFTSRDVDDDQANASWKLFMARDAVKDAFIAQIADSSSTNLGWLASNPEPILRSLFKRWPDGRAESFLNAVLTRAEQSPGTEPSSLTDAFRSIAQRIPTTRRRAVFDDLVKRLPGATGRKRSLTLIAARSVGSELSAEEAAAVLSGMKPVPADDDGAATFGSLYEVVAEAVDEPRGPALLSQLIRAIPHARTTMQLSSLERLIRTVPGAPPIADVGAILDLILKDSGPEAVARRRTFLAGVRKVRPSESPALASLLLTRWQTNPTQAEKEVAEIWKELPGKESVSGAGGAVQLMLTGNRNASSRGGPSDLTRLFAQRLSRQDAFSLLDRLSGVLQIERDPESVARVRGVLNETASRIAAADGRKSVDLLVERLSAAKGSASVRALAEAVSRLPSTEAPGVNRAMLLLLERRRAPTSQSDCTPASYKADVQLAGALEVYDGSRDTQFSTRFRSGRGRTHPRAVHVERRDLPGIEGGVSAHLEWLDGRNEAIAKMLGSAPKCPSPKSPGLHCP